MQGGFASRHAAGFVLVTVVLDSAGIGLIMPVMPELIGSITGEPMAGAAEWGGLLMFLYALMQFSFGPTLGNLSDRFGRRPVLLTSVFLLSVDYLIMALAPTIALLVVGRMLSGIAAATHSTANAFMADVSPPEKRAKNFGLIGAAFGVGFIIGPLIGGLLGEIGPRAPFYAAAGLSFANFLYGYFVLPETLREKDRRPFVWTRANPLGAARQISKLPTVAWFVVVYFFFQLSTFVYPAVWAYFTIEAFGWSTSQVGLSLAAVGLGFAVVQGGLMGPILKRLGEFRTTQIGMIVSAIALAGYAFAPSSLWVWILLPISALGIVANPALTAMMSNRIAADSQGELQGLLASVMALTTIISPIIMTQLFGYFSGQSAPVYFPGAPFLLAALLMTAALVPLSIGVAQTGTTEPDKPEDR